MASRILGMGDVLTLIEQAEQTFDADQAEQMAAKLASAASEFTLEDFLEQMQAVRKMGPIANAARHAARHGADEGPARRTRRPRLRPGRRDHPVDDPGRAGQPEDHQRRPAGPASPTAPGVSVTDVNQLVDRFAEAQKMMKQMAGMMGLPGMGPKATKAAAEEQARKKGKKGKGRPHGGAGPAALGARGMPQGCRRGCPASRRRLAPGQGLPDLPKLELRPVRGRAARPVTTRAALSGVLLPDGEVRDLWVRRRPGHLRAGARRRDGRRGGWMLPGLVDAHCHVGIGAGGAAVEDLGDDPRAGRSTDRDAGVLALRDCGSPVDTRVLDDEPDLPRLVRAGRHIAAHRGATSATSPSRWSPPTWPPRSRAQARRGDGWVKLVGDWIDRDDGDLAPVVAGRRPGRRDRRRPRGGRPGHRAHASAPTRCPT